MAHCIIANNETGIIYSSIMDFLKSVRSKIPIVSADTIQCLGKTTLVDYNLFDIFTFTSQKMFCEAGLSGFIFNSKKIQIADPTIMLCQYLCANLLSGIEQIKTYGDPTVFFTDLYDYTFKKITEVCKLKELNVRLVIDDVGRQVDFYTKEEITDESFDDETVVVIIYRDLREEQMMNTILLSLFMVCDEQLYIIETCQAVAKALSNGFILSKSSFCGQQIKYTSLLGIHPLVSAKGTL